MITRLGPTWATYEFPTLTPSLYPKRRFSITHVTMFSNNLIRQTGRIHLVSLNSIGIFLDCLKVSLGLKTNLGVRHGVLGL